MQHGLHAILVIFASLLGAFAISGCSSEAPAQKVPDDPRAREIRETDDLMQKVLRESHRKGARRSR
jgi:hypothetical protein